MLCRTLFFFAAEIEVSEQDGGKAAGLKMAIRFSESSSSVWPALVRACVGAAIRVCDAL